MEAHRESHHGSHHRREALHPKIHDEAGQRNRAANRMGSPLVLHHVAE